ncbi:MAG: hypothetical protein JXM73_06805 [Anaerolineae bacterium]|nr:hypothetical protein [Anaerolineae bacterium]
MAKTPQRGGVMGLDVWFAQDVARILAATHEAMAASMRATAPLDTETAEAYRTGFVDALRAVAIAFGVAVPMRESSRARNVVDAQARQSGLWHLE